VAGGLFQEPWEGRHDEDELFNAVMIAPLDHWIE